MVVSFYRLLDVDLRMLSIATVLPALIRVLAFGLFTFRDVTIIGLVPLAMSALLGLNVLIRQRSSAVLQTCADILIAVLMLAYFIFNWDWIVHYPRYGSVSIFVLAPMITNLYVHFYCIIIHFRCVFDSFFGDRSCPHCKRSVSSFPHWTQHGPVDPAQAHGAQEIRMRRRFDGSVEE
ncbi:hypothetical protein Q7P36_010892 [Cladosporium allicinum]